MDHETITKGILSGIVDRYIKEISDDPNRSIRKLVDLAECTSDGPTQKICYQMMQEMAANQSSPYYEMIHYLVTHTDPKTIKQFGINLGHNAWTFGSGRMREISENCPDLIPWAMVIDRNPVPDRIPFSEISSLIRRGRAHEIYGWMLMAGNSMNEWDDYAELFREYNDCVFGLCIFPEALTPEILDEITEIHNLMVIISTDDDGWEELLDRLSRNRCLYSVYRTVSTPEQARDIISGNWFSELVPAHPLLAFTVIADSCPTELAEQVNQYMWNTRLKQIYPILPVDLIQDFMIISRLVSHQEILYRVETNGSISVGEELRFEKTPLLSSELFKRSGNSL